jgi:hypothetical protein
MMRARIRIATIPLVPKIWKASISSTAFLGATFDYRSTTRFARMLLAPPAIAESAQEEDD